MARARKSLKWSQHNLKDALRTHVVFVDGDRYVASRNGSVSGSDSGAYSLYSKKLMAWIHHRPNASRSHRPEWTVYFYWLDQRDGRYSLKKNKLKAADWTDDQLREEFERLDKLGAGERDADTVDTWGPAKPEPGEPSQTQLQESVKRLDERDKASQNGHAKDDEADKLRYAVWDWWQALSKEWDFPKADKEKIARQLQDIGVRPRSKTLQLTITVLDGVEVEDLRDVLSQKQAVIDEVTPA